MLASHELGYGVAEWLRLVPVDFEQPADWRDRLTEAGFDPARGEEFLVATT